MRRRILRFIKAFFLSIFITFVIQLLYFTYIYINFDEIGPIEKVDALFIFIGDTDRVEKGFRLAKSGAADYVVVSPANQEKIRKYLKDNDITLNLNFIIENQARTTFENALFCGRVAKAHDFKSVILVSSTYHLPRAYLFFRIMLSFSGINITPIGVGEKFKTKPINKKIPYFYQELAGFWGSFAELAYYKITGQVPFIPLGKNFIFSWLKSGLRL